MHHKRTIRLAAIFQALIWVTLARADEVTDWNVIAMRTIRNGGANALIATRVLAMMHASIYDAVNGIERRYEPAHVDLSAPAGASKKAAAVEAGYQVLVNQFPSQRTALDVSRQESLDAIASGDATDNSQSIARGIEWGRSVADDIIAWRAGDGFLPAPPPYTGGMAAGQWRPTPPAFAPGAGPQFATMLPWAMQSPASFPVGPPPALTSPAYANDLNEVAAIGRNTSTTRTAEQSDIAAFWFGNTPFYWEPLARDLAAAHHNTLSENARFFALLNVAAADAGIACWNTKYTYVYWRPITAITLADTDANNATTADPSWLPLFPTPAHPEYMSGHSMVSSATVTVIESFFGDSTFTIDSRTVPGAMPTSAGGAIRTFTSLEDAAREVGDSRIYAGIHYRNSCELGRATGRAVALFVIENALQPIHGNKPLTAAHHHSTLLRVGDGEVIGPDM
jgi:hypothetical protein